LTEALLTCCCPLGNLCQNWAQVCSLPAKANIYFSMRTTTSIDFTFAGRRKSGFLTSQSIVLNVPMRRYTFAPYGIGNNYTSYIGDPRGSVSGSYNVSTNDWTINCAGTDAVPAYQGRYSGTIRAVCANNNVANPLSITGAGVFATAICTPNGTNVSVRNGSDPFGNYRSLCRMSGNESGFDPCSGLRKSWNVSATLDDMPITFVMGLQNATQPSLAKCIGDPAVYPKVSELATQSVGGGGPFNTIRIPSVGIQLGNLSTVPGPPYMSFAAGLFNDFNPTSFAAFAGCTGRANFLGANSYGAGTFTYTDIAAGQYLIVHRGVQGGVTSTTTTTNDWDLRMT
jgi:hypothetical protein